MPNDTNRFARGLLHLGAAPETLAVMHALRDWVIACHGASNADTVIFSRAASLRLGCWLCVGMPARMALRPFGLPTNLKGILPGVPYQSQ